MFKVFISGVALCALMAGTVVAQVSRTESTTTVENPMTPDASVSKSVKQKTYNSDGSETRSSKSITRSAGGVSSQARSKTIAPDGSEVMKEHEQTVSPDGSSSTTTRTTEKSDR